MDLDEIYKALRSEYNGKLFSDQFLKTHIDLRGDQIICWFEIDEEKEDEGFEEKRDCTISFYDEVVKFLVDRFGEEFKYEDPRISDNYIDKNNIHGQYEIVLDDDGESPAVIAIWENEENEMKPVNERRNEMKPVNERRVELMPQNGRKSFGRKAMEEEDENGFTLYSYETPVARLERRDDGSGLDFCLLDDYLSSTTLTHIHSFLISHHQQDIPTKQLLELNIGETIPTKTTKYAYTEKNLVKEGAGAGYDVGISQLEIGEVTDIQKDGEFDYTFTAKIVPDTYEISAEDYYNDFFWQEHEFGITPKAKIDGGEIHGTICPREDTDDPEFWIQRQVEGSTFNLSFMYGGGWMHVDLPESGQIYVDEHLDITPELYFSIDDIHLDAIDLVQAVNSGYASIFDRDEEEDEDEDEDEEQVNEVSGWKLEDEDLTLVNSESDGDKLYIVKLWWGSGYSLDCYNAYAFSEEEALNYVVAYLEKESPELLKATDEYAQEDEDSFIYVDATMEGANEPHYVWAENLAIAEYPKKHNHPMAKGIDKKRFSESRRDVYTLEVNYLDEDGEPQTIEAMKYAKTYYSFEDALNAAKEAYLEYSKAFDEPVEVYVMGGEYETDGGDIYGEPVLLEVVSADTIDSL